MGAGASQAESPSGSAGPAGTPVSRHAGAAGKGGGRLVRWMRRTHGNHKIVKIPNYVAHDLGAETKIQRPRSNSARGKRLAQLGALLCELVWYDRLQSWRHIIHNLLR